MREGRLRPHGRPTDSHVAARACHTTHCSHTLSTTPSSREVQRMRSLVTTLFLAVCALVAIPTAPRAQSLLFDYVGFDYEIKSGGPAFGDVGNEYVGLSTVPFLFAPLTSNTTLNEYTCVMNGLTSTGFMTIGAYRLIDYTGGTITIYEDAKAG